MDFLDFLDFKHPSPAGTELDFGCMDRGRARATAGAASHHGLRLPKVAGLGVANRFIDTEEWGNLSIHSG